MAGGCGPDQVAASHQRSHAGGTGRCQCDWHRPQACVIIDVSLDYSMCCRWLGGVDQTKWLHHISGLMRAALVVVNAIDTEKRPVLVHCSDGWDRTPQIVALAELMLDPYYRTLEVMYLACTVILYSTGFSHHLGSPECYWTSFFHFVLSNTFSSFNPTFSI